MQVTSSAYSAESIEHREFLEYEGIRTDLIVIPKVSFDACQVQGPNLDFFPPPIITMWPNLKEADKDAYNFLLYRQFYYLGEHAVSKMKLATLVAMITSSVAAYFFTMDTKVSIATGTTAMLTTFYILEVKFFKEADDYAIKHCSNEQLLGGLRYLRALKNLRFCHLKKNHNANQENLADGDFIGHWFPTISSRYLKITNEIERRQWQSYFPEEKPLDWDIRTRAIANVIEAQLKGNSKDVFKLI